MGHLSIVLWIKKRNNQNDFTVLEFYISQYLTKNEVKKN